MATDLFADSSGPKDLLAGVKKDDPGFTAGDYLKGLKKGLLEVPGSLTGLIDIPIAAVTGQKVAGPVAEALGKGTGLEFGKWAKETGETLSPGAQTGQAKINEAWKGSGADRLGNALLGNFDDLPEAWRNANLRSAGKAILENPGASLMQVVESVPGMAAGGAIGKGVVVAGKVAPWLAGGIGEGAITAGQQMDQTADTVDPRRAALTSLAAGVGTGLIGAGGGRLAGKLGFDDLQTAMAGGAAGSRTKLLPRIAGGATMEATQELPQSMQETAWQNFAEDKPLGEGVLRSGVEGAIAGGVMGGVAGLRPRARQAEQPPPPGIPTDADIAGSNAANAELGKAFDAYTGAPPLLEEKPIIVQNPTTGNITELDRRAGPLEAAAAQAVESGLTSIAQNVNAGEVLQPFQNLQTAQGYVQMQADPEMFDVIPHPRVAGTQAVVPKTGADRQAILDKRTAAGANQAAKIRAAQLEQEEAPNETGITEKIKGRFGDGGEGTVTLTPRNDGGFEVSVVSQTGPAKRTSRAGFAGGVSKAEAIKQATAAHGGFTSEKEAPAEPKPEVDTAVEDATQDELAPQPVQKVTDMPGVQQQAKAQAEEAVSKARVRVEQLAAEENPETVDAQAQAANPAPTDAQKSAGNYAKGHLSIGGLNISVETPAGATRTGRDGAKPWKVKNTAHYGYVKRTNGADGEQVDVYVKPGTAATHDGQVFVVDQYHPGTGAFDEHKAMIGYGNAAEAAKAYDAHFSDQSGAKRRGAVTAMPLGGFKTWLKNGDTMRPVSSRKFDGQASDPAQEAQDEIAQSTGARFSRQRKGEPDTDYLQRQVKEAEAALAASKKGRRKGESRDAYLQRRVEEARAKLSAASVTPPLPRTRREGESDTDYLRRRADEANAAKDARQTPPAKAFPTKARDEAAVREALGLENDAGVSILSPESRPDAGQARGVSKQAAQFIVQAARLFGKRVVFFDVPDPNAAEGIYAQDNTIYLNVNSSTQHLRVLGHELTHAMKNQAGEAYEKMLGAVAALRTDAEMVAQYKDYFNEDLDNPARLYQPHPGTQGTLREFLAEEWMADLGGNRFAESDFWTAVFAQLETQHGAPAAQGIIARLRAALVTALNKLKGLIGGNAFAVDARLAEHLEDIRVAVAQGFAEYARRSKAGALSGGSGQGTKFSPQKETTQTAFVEAVPSERTRAGLAAGALSGAQKSAFTQYVFGKVDPAKVARGVLGRIDVRVEVLASTGGYQPEGAESGKISPNVLVQVTPIGKRAVTLEEAVRVAQALNYVYTQDGVPVSRYDDQLLDVPANTPNVTHIVRFTLPGLQEGHAVSAQEEAFYRHLEKVYGVGIGYSKIDGKIVVGNYAGLAPEEFHRLAAEVAQAAGIKFEGTAAEGDYVFHDWENDGQGVDHEVWGNGDTAGRPNLQARLHGWRDGAVQTAAGWLDERGIKYSPGRRADIGGRYVGPESGRADSGSGGSVSGQSARRQDGQVSVTGVHFSKEPRSHLSGVYFDKGTGTKSQEAERVRQATDVRIKSRIYAYVNEGKGVFPEENVGRHAHKVAFDNLYDAAADPLDLWVKYRDANTRESAILDAGFDGYYARGAFGNQGVAILMGKAATRGIAPDYRGTEYRGKELEVPPVGEPSEFGKQQQAITANRGLPDGEMTGADWKRLMPRLMPDIDVSHLDDAKKYYKNEIAQRPAKLSPARLAMAADGLTVKKSPQRAALQEQRDLERNIAKQIQYNQQRRETLPENHPMHVVGERALARLQTRLAGVMSGLSDFRAWFGESKAVDAEGLPLVLYHGTAADFTSFRRKDNGRALWAADTLTANSYAGESSGSNVMPVFFSMQNPLEIDAGGSNWQRLIFEGSHVSTDDLTDIAEERGFDGVIVRNLLDHDTDDGGDIEADHFAVLRPEQIKSATGNNGQFSPDNPDIRYSPVRATLGTLTPAQEAAANHVLGAPKTFMQRLAEFKKDWAKNLKQGIFDQFAPIAELDQNAYILARLSKGGESSLEALMLYGKLFVGADGATDVHYTKAGKPQGFASKMSELKGEHDRFFLWVAAQRADRLKAIGLENLFSATDIAELKTLNQGAMKDGTGRPLVYAKALQDLNDFNDNVLEVAVASGLIDDQTRQMYRNTPYIPFYRLQEDDEVSGFGIKPGLVNQYAWKKLKGGTEQLNQDLMANLLHNWSHLITASARNRAAKATLDAAEKAGIAQQVASSLGPYVANKTTMLPPGTKGQVSYKEGSVEKSFVISDPHLMDAVAALHYAGLGPWAKPLSTAKHWLTVGVTANPAFKLRNLIRDTIGALGTAQLSYRADQNLVQGWRATAEDSETRAHLLASGGMIRFGSMLDGKDSQRAQDLIKAGVDPNMILDSDAKIRRFWKRFVSPALTAYNELGDRTEQVNRAALYEQLIAKGLTHAEAAYWARDLMDFSMSGKWTAIRTLTQTVPFFNARLQGLYKLGRAGKQDIRRLGTVLGAVTLASLALLLAYQDDDDWKKRWDSDRNNYWWFKVGGHAFRLPKPFEIGAVGTLAERSYEVAFNSEMTGDRFGKNLRDIVMSQLSMNPVPQLFKPMMDLYANRDSFTGQAIESMGMERLRKQDRFDERTSETAKFLGSLGLPDLTQFVMGRWDTLSPRQIDFLAKGYFSWLATMATTVLDYGIRPMINAGDRPDRQLKDVFFVGNFVESLPSNSSRYLTQMYDQAREIEQAYASYHARLKVGDVEGAKKILAEDGDLIRRQKATEALKRTESLMNVQLQRINASTTLTGEEKRIRLDQVYARRNAIAEQFRAL